MPTRPAPRTAPEVPHRHGRRFRQFDDPGSAFRRVVRHRGSRSTHRPQPGPEVGLDAVTRARERRCGCWPPPATPAPWSRSAPAPA
ncbi:hypothetical protein NKG94_30775 [Micromonospora sp. M12]